MPVTDEQLNSFLTSEGIAEVQMRPVQFEGLSWLKPIQIRDKFDKQVWGEEKIIQAERDLAESMGANDLIPPNEREQQQRLNSWWREKGQFIPEYVIKRLGVFGGEKVPTLQESINLERKNQVKAVQEFLGITRQKNKDPLDELVRLETITDPTDISRKPIKPEMFNVIKSASNDDLNIIRDTIASNPLEFDEGMYRKIEDEIRVRELLPSVYEMVGEKPLTVLLGTDFFNTIAGNLPEYVSRKGLSPAEHLLGLPKGTESQYIRAVARVREQIAEQDPSTLTRIGLETGNIAANLIKFALIPDPSKATVFTSLSPVVQSAIGVGTKAGLVELLQAPRPEETPMQRFEDVAVTTGIGALTGAVLQKAIMFAKDIPVKIRAAKLAERFPQISQSDWSEILKVAQENRLIYFEMKPPVEPARRIAPAGFRLGMAEIEKPAKALGKVIKQTPKLKEAAAIEAAKVTLGLRTQPSKIIKPTKILTKQEALSLQQANLVTGEGENIRIVADSKTKKLLQTKENEIAGLKNRRNELMAQKQFAVARTKAQEIAKKEEALAELKEKSGIKIEQTIEGAKEKISKIRAAQKFKDELRNDAVSMITAIPKELRAKFINRANMVRTLKGLQKLTDEIEQGIDKYERKLAIGDLRQTIKEIESKNRLGKVRLGKIPSPQREKIIDIIDEISLRKISTQLEPVTEIKGVKEIKPEIQSVVDRYDEGELDSVEDVIDEIESLEDLPNNIEDAIENYQQAVKDDLREHGGRSGLPEDAEEKLFDILRAKEKEIAPTTREKTFGELDVKARRGREQLLGADLQSLQKVTQRLSSELAGNLEALDEGVDATLRLPNERVRQLNLLTQKNIDEIDTDDIRLVTESLQNLAHNAKLKGRLLTKKGYEPLDGAIKTITENEISPTKKAIKKKELPAIAEKGKLEKAGEFGKRILKYDDAHLDTLIELSTNPERSKIRQVLDTDLHEGARKTATKLNEWIGASAERFREIGFDDIEQLGEEVEVTLAGKKIKLSKDYLVKLELHSRSPENLRAILSTEGWQIGKEKLVYPLNAQGNDLVDRLGELREALKIVRDDPVLRAIADWDNDLNAARAETINETSQILNGHDIARDPFYTSRPRVLPKRVEGTKEISVPPEQIGRYLPRTGGTMPIRLDKWSEDFLTGLESDASYYGMSIPLRNARILASNPKFQDAMKAAGHEIELNNMITILRRTQGITTSKSTLEVFGGRIQRGVTASALGFRVSTIGAQAMSYPAAFAEVDSIMRPMLPVGKETLARIEEDSPLLALRWKGRRIGVEVGASATAEPFEILLFGKSKRLSNKALQWMISGDKFAIGNIYKQGVIPEILNKPRNGKNVNPLEWDGIDVADLPALEDVDSEEFRYAAARRLEYVVRRTQPMYDMLDRSVSLSNPNIFERTFFIFRTALEAQENIGMRAIDTYSKSAKSLADKKELAKDIGSVTASAFAVAAWKRGLKWAIGTSITAILAAFGIYKFDDKKERESLSENILKDTAKNIVRLNKVGKFAVEIGERAADSITGDGYNWNRNSFDNPMLDVLQTGSDTIVAFSRALSDAGLLDNFVEEITQDDKDFNKQLADRIGKDFERVLRSSYEFGVRITGQPLLAPVQEFLRPMLAESKIKIIREVTYSDVESPQKFSERVFALFEKRKELNSKSRTKRLTREEQMQLDTLNSFASKANKLADIVKEMDNPENRKMRFQLFEISIGLTEDRIK